MTLSTRIAPLLPFLRRYARAVAGSQTSGDAFVAAVLETLIADPLAFPHASNDRIALYKLFAKLFSSIKIQFRPIVSPFAWEKRAAQNLGTISPVARQTFLLAYVEDFGSAEIAEILDIDEVEVTRLLDEASQQISDQVATTILIIEDEPLIAIDIEQMVTELGHRVAGIARTYEEAVALFSQAQPGMVLADIHLADGSSGLDAVNEILKKSAIPVIFITAYPERLLTGTRPEPAFLITKPFSPDMVKALISQALFFDEATERAA